VEEERSNTMARGADGKAARKARKAASAEEAERLLAGGGGKGSGGVNVEADDSSSDDDDDDIDDNNDEDNDEGVVSTTESSKTTKTTKTKTTSKSARARKAVAAHKAARGGGPPDLCCGPKPSSKGGIKTLPLVMLVMLTGTTLIPAILYAGDYFSAYLSKNNFMGNLGFRLGIGPSPKKRVTSFYEKHDPEKLHEVPSILAKYYGDYPTLVKRLERKYADYGYFLNWEQDEAAMTLAFEKMWETKDILDKQFNMYAPAVVKTGARNMRHNFGYLYRKGNRLWKKQLWPFLEPYLGVPDAKTARKQKLKDKKDAERRKKEATGQRRRSAEFRDEDEHNEM
jgi:hypothetical protein